MKTKTLFAVAAVGVCCIAILSGVFSPASIQGSTTKKYELHPEVYLPEHRSDAARAINAYERLMERYMDMTESRYAGFGADLKGVERKLDSINGKLTELSARMARIERALGIEQPQKLLKQSPTAPIKPQIKPGALKNPQILSAPKKAISRGANEPDSENR